MSDSITSTPIIDALARFGTDTRYEDLPPQVVTATKHVLLDSIGSGLGGVTTDPGKIAISVAQALGGPPECAILGTGLRVGITNAVFANGQLVNALDFDTVMAGGHTPPYIVPTMLAAAERQDASGRALVTATAIALEIAARMGTAVPRAMQFVGEAKEFRYAKREGYARVNFGAAAGAGHLHGLAVKDMVQALAHAGHMSQLNTWSRGNYAIPRNLAKYGYSGWQNTGAILAVLLAEQGLPGDVSQLDDDEHGYGEFSGYDAWDPSGITADIGERWLIAETPIPFKPYACCTMLHRGVECFETIMEEERLRPDEIESVVVSASPTVTAELFQDRTLDNIVDFQFGMPYVIAMSAYGERTGADWQDWQKLSHPRIKAFADKVTLVPQPDFGETQLSTVTVVARGREFQHGLVGGTTPLDEAALVAKFANNAARVLTARKSAAATEALLDLERLTDLKKLVRNLSV